MKEKYKTQLRDSKGRWIKMPTTKRYCENDINEAFIAGLNATGKFLSSSQKLKMYKESLK